MSEETTETTEVTETTEETKGETSEKTDETKAVETEAKAETQGILDAKTEDEKTEEKTGEEKKDSQTEEKKEETKEEKKSEVPEKYELTLPKDSPLDDGAVERIAAIAAERGLSNKDAQALLESESQSVDEVLIERSNRWAKEIEQDKELGGEHLNETKALCKRVMDKFGTDEFKAELIRNRLVNNPHLVRVFRSIGKAMSDDKNDAVTTVGNARKSDVEVFYGKNE